MKGIILAGGLGTRLHPLTRAISKQLLPVYKYPMIYFPIGTLRDMGIKEILIITTRDQQEFFWNTLVGHVNDVSLSFAVQNEPRGLAEAFIIAEPWLAGDDATLVLGDNIIINNTPLIPEPNTIYSYPVKHPERYGVVEKDVDGNILRLIEKPTEFVSNEAVIGLYTLHNSACQYAKSLKPSKRGELEIVDLILTMNEHDQKCQVKKLDGFWFDAGNHDDLLDCGNLIRAIEHRTNRSFDLK